MTYTIVFRKSALKQLRQLPKSMVGRIVSAIDELATEPRPVNCKKLKAVDNTYRVRIGDYRVLYTIDDAVVTVEVVKIGHRRTVYDA